MLQRHAVIGDKTKAGNGHGGEDTDPADPFIAKGIPKAKVGNNRNADGDRGADKLTKRETEKDALVIVPYFPWNLDLHKLTPFRPYGP